jgi:glucose-1-phosphate cytidylyltransferase
VSLLRRLKGKRDVMKTVILAGGMGTRMSEETVVRPKPMVEIGGKPILWHIMKLYSSYGLNDFIICLGFKGYIIKEYFANYFLHNSDVTFDLKTNEMEVHQSKSEHWKVTLIDTGDETMTGGRLKRVRSHLGDDTFCLTYGDGVSDINLTELIDFHKREQTLATITAVQPPGRFGLLTMDADRITGFSEKPPGDGAWVSGGFFVLSPQVIELIDGDATVWEHEPIERLAAEGQLAAFRHRGFWQCMDTLRDRIYLQKLWDGGNPPWTVNWQS